MTIRLILFIFLIANLESAYSYTSAKYRVDNANFRKAAKLYIPKDLKNGEKRPLFILLHGYTDPGFHIHLNYPIFKLVDSEKYFLLQPYGTTNQMLARFWDTGEWCCNLTKEPVDDTFYLSKLIKHALAKNSSIDSQKVFVLGHSNGAFMAFKMACNASDIISGIVAYGGTGLFDYSKCEINRPLKILQIHGKKDSVVKYGGIDKIFPSAAAPSKFWTKQFGCDSLPVKSSLSFAEKGPLSSIEVSTFDNCLSGSYTRWDVTEGKHLTILGKKALPNIIDFLLN